METTENILRNPRDQAEEVRALQDTIYVIGGKWRLPIINSICNGNKRFREIERSIPGITTRMLSKELKEMEAKGAKKVTVRGAKLPEKISGAEVISRAEDSMVFNYGSGDIKKLLQALSSMEITDLLIEDVKLSDVFMSYYTGEKKN